MHPGWMALEHLEGVGGWVVVERWVGVGKRAGHGGEWERVPRAGRGRTHSGGSRTTRQGSTTGVGPVEGRWGGFGVSWVSAMAGGAGCKDGVVVVSRSSGGDSPLHGHGGVGDTLGPRGVICYMPVGDARVGGVGCVGLVRCCRGGQGWRGRRGATHGLWGRVEIRSWGTFGQSLSLRSPPLHFKTTNS